MAQLPWPRLLGGIPGQWETKCASWWGAGHPAGVPPSPHLAVSDAWGQRGLMVHWVVLADAFCGRPPISKGLWGPTSPARTVTPAQACEQHVVWLCFDSRSAKFWPLVPLESYGHSFLELSLVTTQQPCPTQACPDIANPCVMKCPSIRVPRAPSPPGSSNTTWSLLCET